MNSSPLQRPGHPMAKISQLAATDVHQVHIEEQSNTLGDK